jgi:hypothetical protein
MRTPGRNFIAEYGLLLVVLAIGLAHGLIYIAIMPPWQHYDEPNHFEYAWLMTWHNNIPKTGDYDPQMSRNVIESMVRHGFYRGATPPLLTANEPVRISGQSQIGKPIGYYWLASQVMRQMDPANVDGLLYAGRLVSLILYLITLTAAWGATGELTAPSSPLRWMIPVSLAFLPGFVDVMTAFNSEAAAVAVYSLFVWGCTRLLVCRPTWLNMTATIGLAGLCLLTKETAYIAVPILGLVILFAVLRGRLRPLAYGLPLAGLLVIGLTVLSPTVPATWYPAVNQDVPFILKSDSAVNGKYVLQLDPSAAVTPWYLPMLTHLARLEDSRPLAGKPVTFGLWMWADRKVDAITPALNFGPSPVSKSVRLDTEPRFFAFQVDLPETVNRVWLTIQPPFSQPLPPGTRLFYDGLVLAQGSYSPDWPPQFAEGDPGRGVWDGKPFVNLARNPSMETWALGIRPPFNRWIARPVGDLTNFSFDLATIFDPAGSGWYYRDALAHMLRTFWAKFGWGHVPLAALPLVPDAYILLFIITGVGGAAALARLWMERRRARWEVVFVFGVMIAVAWLLAIMRGPIFLSTAHVFTPVARYTYIVIIPMMTALNYGWTGCAWVMVQFGERLQRPDVVRKGLAGGYILFWAALAVYSILSIRVFYQ